jgi:hypothetical protein
MLYTVQGTGIIDYGGMKERENITLLERLLVRSLLFYVLCIVIN